jgi:uncharacterized protein YecT (DUF1311 family)
MNPLNILLSLLILMMPLISYADEASLHSIDKMHQTCIDRDSTTEGMTKCAYAAYELWDKELNKNYNELMRQLPTNSKQALKTAQKEWLIYRDKEFYLIDQIYSQLEGTMHVPMRVNEQVQIVKKRALQLKIYLDLLKKN